MSLTLVLVCSCFMLVADFVADCWLWQHSHSFLFDSFAVCFIRMCSLIHVQLIRSLCRKCFALIVCCLYVIAFVCPCRSLCARTLVCVCVCERVLLVNFTPQSKWTTQNCGDEWRWFVQRDKLHVSTQFQRGKLFSFRIKFNWHFLSIGERVSSSRITNNIFSLDFDTESGKMESKF